MIVLRSTYDELEEKYKDTLESLYVAEFNFKLYKDGYKELAEKHNKLVREYNATWKKMLLSQEDIQKLILLCHPDKHDGKPMANEMTQKLLGMRK